MPIGYFATSKVTDRHLFIFKIKRLYKLKDEYNYIVDWAMGQSEGMISQEKLIKSGGFDNFFELFIDLKEKEKF